MTDQEIIEEVLCNPENYVLFIDNDYIEAINIKNDAESLKFNAGFPRNLLAEFAEHLGIEVQYA